MKPNSPHDENAIRDRAYFLWQAEGSPDGREEEFWYKAIDTTGSLDGLVPPAPDIVDRAVETARKIGLQRGFKKSSDDKVSGGFNQAVRRSGEPTETAADRQQDDNIDDLGRRRDGTTLDQPGADGVGVTKRH